MEYKMLKDIKIKQLKLDKNKFYDIYINDKHSEMTISAYLKSKKEFEQFINEINLLNVWK
jgi:hypothetical protein